jgi:hypothetical protein
LEELLYVFLAIILNVLIALSYNADKDRMNNPKFYELSNTDTEILILVLGIINLFTGTIVVATTLAVQIPYNYQKFKVMDIESRKREKEDYSNLMFEQMNEAYMKLYYLYGAVKMIITDPTVFYHVFYFISLILGLVLHPFCYAFCLTYVIIRSSTLVKILQAGYSPRKKIILTLLLFLMVVYFFSIIKLKIDYDF